MSPELRRAIAVLDARSLAAARKAAQEAPSKLNAEQTRLLRANECPAQGRTA